MSATVGSKIQSARWSRDLPIGGSLNARWELDDQRYVDDLLVQGARVELASVVAKLFAMIGVNNDGRVVVEAAISQLGKQPADFGIDKT